MIQLGSERDRQTEIGFWKGEFFTSSCYHPSYPLVSFRSVRDSWKRVFFFFLFFLSFFPFFFLFFPWWWKQTFFFRSRHLLLVKIATVSLFAYDHRWVNGEGWRRKSVIASLYTAVYTIVLSFLLSSFLSFPLSFPLSFSLFLSFSLSSPFPFLSPLTILALRAKTRRVTRWLLAGW